MGIRAILLRARTRACAWAAVWAVLLSMVQTAPANVRLDLADLPPENRVGGFSETFENRAGQNVAFVQYPRLENEPILAMTASGRLFWLSRDPLGEQADPLHNLYRFVGNNPLNYVDPYGLQQNPQTRELENRARAMGAGGAYVFSAAGPPSYKPGGGKELPAPPVSTPAPKSSPNAYPPNRGFMPGEGTPASLLPGAVVDRYGDPTGSFLSPQGTPVAARSLSPGAENRPLNTYDVMRPIPVDAGRIAPYYNQTGLGIQFDIWPFSVQDYVESGHLCPRK